MAVGPRQKRASQKGQLEPTEILEIVPSLRHRTTLHYLNLLYDNTELGTSTMHLRTFTEHKKYRRHHIVTLLGTVLLVPELEATHQKSAISRIIEPESPELLIQNAGGNSDPCEQD